jgi:hypothetical protein
MSLASHLRVGLGERLVIALAPPLVLLIAVKITELMFGYERIVFYEQALAVLATSAVVVALTGGRVLLTLDLVTIGVGAFLSFGRIGCLMVGCCHGRPARWGIRYGDAHAAAGFTSRWVGRPLFPLQLVDSLVSLAMVIASTVCLLGPSPAGDPAVLWFTGYGFVRFLLEFARGDASRPYFRGLSEAQWTAWAISAFLALLRPGSPWVLGSALLLTALVAALMLGSRRLVPSSIWLTNPYHVKEVGRFLHWPEFGRVAITTLGLRLSLHELPDQRSDLVLSLATKPLDERSVRALARQLHPAAIVKAGAVGGVFHIVLPRAL